MPRAARIVAVGYPHHITQRGNRNQNVFNKDLDYRRYLKWLERYRNEYGLSILAYCLMPNHVHFAAVPRKEVSLAKTFSVCHTLYSQYFNKKSNASGHLWQGRFYSCILDEKHLYAAIRYIENNPVRAKLVKSAEEWKWSSAKYHLNKEMGILSLDEPGDFITIYDWKAYLQNEDDKIIQKIRVNTSTGKPLGDNFFISKLERLLGKRIKPLQRGRPKKKEGNKKNRCLSPIFP